MDDHQVAQTLSYLSDTNRLLDLFEEGIQQAKEASEIFERLSDTVKQASCLINLAWALYDNDEQLDAAEEAASRAIELLPEEGEQRLLSHGHRVLGKIYASKGETDEAIHHFEVALRAATSLDQLFWIHFALAELFGREGRYNDAHPHIEHAKSYAANDPYALACASWLQACFWDRQYRFEEAKSEALRALDLYEKLGAAADVERSRQLLEQIENDAQREDSDLDTRDESGDGGELPETMLLVMRIDSSWSDGITDSE